MVGRLSLREAPELPPDSKRRALDSPDSGLPPSPGSWLLSAAGSESSGGVAHGLPPESEPKPGSLPPPGTASSPPSLPHPSCPSRLSLLSFGEGVEFDPLPPTDIRYTSSVTYDSEKRFIDDVYLPMGLGVSSCSQTVLCVAGSTWRRYKAEVRFEPRVRPRRFTSTTIVYPKRAKTVYTATLDYNCRKFTRRFLSSVELESAGSDGSPEDC
ncbi:refilin-B [Hemicordylus capensis]|uniref:refilin-B n=1 Tax=Hemicordylus capensis TaxID=884348 RepID=UPI0023025C42|nr:refilin-B [Hemicordylus capensis]